MPELTPQIQKQVKQAIGILKNGGVVAYPTDTVYGLGAMMQDITAVERIFEIKGRTKGMALPLLLSSDSQITTIAKVVSPAALQLAKVFLPGALTIILLKSKLVPEVVTAGAQTIAFRIPNHPVALALINGVGMPVIGTSANLSGRPAGLTAAEVTAQIGEKIDMIIDGGKCPGGVESTIIDLTGDIPVIRRQGAISLDTIRQVLPETIMA